MIQIINLDTGGYAQVVIPTSPYLGPEWGRWYTAAINDKNTVSKHFTLTFVSYCTALW